METISPDADLDGADWTKQAWDLPPYMSAEFLELVPPEDLASFKQRPVYKHAVAAGLIHDDEWVGDSIADEEPPTEDAKPRAKRRNIHIHL